MLLEETPAYLGNALKAINQTQLLGVDMISYCLKLRNNGNHTLFGVFNKLSGY